MQLFENSSLTKLSWKYRFEDPSITEVEIAYRLTSHGISLITIPL